MARKLEAAGLIRRSPDPADNRATVVELTGAGRATTDDVKQLWLDLARQTVAGLPADTVGGLPALLGALADNVGTRKPPPPGSAPGPARGC